MQQHFFSFESSELQKNKPDPSSHCSSVQERLVTYGSEALDTAEHLGLILGSQKQADALLEHFGSNFISSIIGSFHPPRLSR
jgi:DNA repair protein RadC